MLLARYGVQRMTWAERRENLEDHFSVKCGPLTLLLTAPPADYVCFPRFLIARLRSKLVQVCCCVIPAACSGLLRYRGFSQGHGPRPAALVPHVGRERFLLWLQFSSPVIIPYQISDLALVQARG